MGRSSPSERDEQILRLFHAVAELGPEDRSRFLRQNCSDSSVISEVENLLAHEQVAHEVPEAFERILRHRGDDAEPVRDRLIGATISRRYAVEKRLGGGGMGVVYRARDNKLDRTVALKFLHPYLTRDEEAKERFIQEAKAASALDHPNISTVHDVGETEDGQLYISMAYYNGDTLKRRLSHTRLPVERALDYAMQIGAGLARAHREGIVHRDVKPGNVMVTEEDRAVIVDFGLAKFRERNITQSGVLMGTVAYMSPEQVQGDVIDNRSDLWSLGVTLYEMLTQRQPFRGVHDQAVIFSILNENPEPVSSLLPAVPAGTDELISRSLAKDRRERFGSADEMIDSVERLSSQPLKELRSSAGGGPLKGWVFAGLGLLAFAVLSIVAVSYTTSDRTSVVDSPRRTTLTSYLGEELAPSFAPDGNQIAFAWNGEDRSNWDIYTKQIGVGTYEPRRLTEHPGDDALPAWSPDGQYIAFLRTTDEGFDVIRIPSYGGNEQRLTSLMVPSMLSWSPNGQSLVFVDRDSAGGSLKVKTLSVGSLERGQLTHPPADTDDLFAKISPDGSMLAFVRGKYVDFTSKGSRSFRMTGPGDVYVMSLPDGEPVLLAVDHAIDSWKMGLAWSVDSREIIYSVEGGIMRVPARGGTPESIPVTGDQNLYPDISSDGNRLAYVEQGDRRTSFWQYELSGATTSQPVPLIRSAANEASAEYSPDGTRIVFGSTRSGTGQIWVCDRDGRNERQLTFSDIVGGTPRWSPDSRFIAFDAWNESGFSGIAMISSDGGSFRFVTPDSISASVPFWSYDGNWIYFSGGVPDRDGDVFGNVWRISADGNKLLRLTSSGGQSPRESPDGQWIYYYREATQSIWRKQVSGGKESLVLENFHGNAWGNWVVFDDGMYYSEYTLGEGVTIKYLSFATREAAAVASVADFGQYLHVSPDRRQMLVQRGPWGDADLVMLEGWR